MLLNKIPWYTMVAIKMEQSFMELLPAPETHTVITADNFMSETDQFFYELAINHTYKRVNRELLQLFMDIHFIYPSVAGRDKKGIYIQCAIELKNGEHNLIVVKHYYNDDFSIMYHNKETKMYSSFHDNIGLKLKEGIYP